MKKLLTLFALLTCFLGANAITVVDAMVDFTQKEDGAVDFAVWGGGDRLSYSGGYLHYHGEAATDNPWDVQFFPCTATEGVEPDVTYTVEFKIKGTAGQPIFNMKLGGVDKYGVHTTSGDWEIVTVEYVPTSGDGGVLFQCGAFVGDWDMEYMKITHEQAKESRPVDWYNIINEEEPYVYSVFKSTENEKAGISADDIYALVKEVPAQTIDGEKVFAYTSSAVNKTDYTTNVNGDDISANYAWANQLFIKSPVALKSGETVKISFEYKATTPANTNTQAHGLPTYYQHWEFLGDVKFTPEWQSIEKQVTISSDQAGKNGVLSVAFNLNPDVQAENTYYLKNIKIEKMKLDEGFFVASTNTETNLVEYDLDNATQFEYDEEMEAMVAIVGTEGDPSSWVNELMISTVRGNDRAFKGATIKATIKTADDWYAYQAGSNAKIKLPAQGVYMVLVDEAQGLIAVSQIEGDEIIVKDPINVVANPTHVIINGQERDTTADEQKESLEGNGTGNPWDNQFLLMGSRKLNAGEETVISFKYKAAKPATVGTQCGGDTPGAYVHWNALGDLNFTEEEQTFEMTYTVPAEAADMQSFNFNMAVLKDANVYEIYDVIWKTADNTESLIDMEGTTSFYVKEGANTAPYEFGTENPNKGVKGDVNGDKVVNIDDVTAVIGVICGGETIEKADVNGDTNIDIDDVTAIINIICASAE